MRRPTIPAPDARVDVHRLRIRERNADGFVIVEYPYRDIIHQQTARTKRRRSIRKWLRPASENNKSMQSELRKDLNERVEERPRLQDELGIPNEGVLVEI